MHDKLMRSRHDRMIAGVCAGLGNYFDIDPTIVRLVMALLLVTGIGVLMYPLLWLLMPTEPPSMLPSVPPLGLDTTWQPLDQQFNPRAPDSAPLRFDPYTGQPIRFDPYTGRPVQSTQPLIDADAPQAATGATVQLQDDPTGTAAPVQAPAPPTYTPPVVAGRTHSRRPLLGFLLVAGGIAAFADQLNLQLDYLFPVALIALGVFMLLRQRSH